MLHFDVILFHFKETIQIFSKIPTFPQNSYLFPTKIEEKAEIPTPSTFSDQCGHPAIGFQCLEHAHTSKVALAEYVHFSATDY